jgi:hypothetical protein
MLEEHARCPNDNGELEAKSLFRHLSYCPDDDELLLEKPAESK